MIFAIDYIFVIKIATQMGNMCEFFKFLKSMKNIFIKFSIS